MMAAIDTMNDSAHQMNKILHKIIKKSTQSNSEQIVKKMTETGENGQLRFIENAPRAKHVDAEKYAEILQGFEQYRDNVRQDIRIFLGNFNITDIIRYSVGVGSFGTRCYLVLLTGNEGESPCPPN